MQLRTGIPLLSEVDALVGTDLYRTHTQYNRDFLARHGQALDGYGKHWGQDPFQLWSRRWEYPFVAERLLAFIRKQGDRPVTILDAGSGVTYFDYFICDQAANANVVCVDYDKTYPEMFAAINANTPHARVSFRQASLQDLPLETASLDAVACISVLEHTDNYDQIIAEFARVLRTDGAMVLTFDLSLDGKFELARPVAEKLLDAVARYFTFVDGDNPKAQLAAMDEQREAILSTDAIKRTAPELLPWRYPLLKGLHDFAKGKGWTGGFRSKSVFCLDARKR
jgi:ubiquinone/menaquinone biosynthesis C-methylase UbiE